MTSVSEALSGLTEIIDSSGDVDDVLRAALQLLVDEPSIVWAGIRFVEDGVLVLGPTAGVPDESRRRSVPIVYREDEVGELVADGDPAPGLLDEVAAVIAPYVLLGWDTGGEMWVP